MDQSTESRRGKNDNIETKRTFVERKFLKSNGDKDINKVQKRDNDGREGWSK